MEAAHFQLLLGDLDGTKEAMDKCAKILDGFDSVEAGVHASFYRVCGDYYKVSSVDTRKKVARQLLRSCGSRRHCCPLRKHESLAPRPSSCHIVRLGARCMEAASLRETLSRPFAVIPALTRPSFTSCMRSQAKAEYANYYKNSLLYLACVNVDADLTASDRVQRAHDLGVSALLGDTIYNFGELVSAIHTCSVIPFRFGGTKSADRSLSRPRPLYS